MKLLLIESGEGHWIAFSIGVVAASAYCLVILAALLLPETAGRELDSAVVAPAEPGPAAMARTAAE